MKLYRYILLTIVIICSCFELTAENGTGKAVYEVTASRLNVRKGPSTGSAVIGVLNQGAKVEGEKANGTWIRISLNSQYGYIHSDYVRTVKTLSQDTQKSRKSFWDRLEPGPFGWFLIIIFVIPFLFGLAKGLFQVLLELIGAAIGQIIEIIGIFGPFYILFFLAFLPFRILNWLQRFLHKPWRILQRNSWPSEEIKPFLRVLNIIAMVPLYIVLTPLRLANAIAFNLILRPLSEYWNYICEVFAPCAPEEGRKGFWRWIAYLPVRILKYPVFHGLLTLIECIIFTIADTIYPAVTLYHGTDGAAADAIIISPTRTRHHKKTCRWTDGIWNVGGGNYAGDGIYFAPRSSTSMHYARNCANPVLIICRVSLGRLLPLSLAPDNVYASAGHPNAHAVTRYGLDNGYTSIEWWRSDSNWWEYCLLDWQNKYNESWRIRPVMAMNLSSYFFKRIHGGTRHWLFDREIFKDLCQSIGF